MKRLCPWKGSLPWTCIDNIGDSISICRSTSVANPTTHAADGQRNRLDSRKISHHLSNLYQQGSEGGSRQMWYYLWSASLLWVIHALHIRTIQTPDVSEFTLAMVNCWNFHMRYADMKHLGNLLSTSVIYIWLWQTRLLPSTSETPADVITNKPGHGNWLGRSCFHELPAQWGGYRRQNKIESAQKSALQLCQQLRVKLAEVLQFSMTLWMAALDAIHRHCF